MTINKLIAHLEAAKGVEYVHYPKEMLDSMIALIQAAQAMRDAQIKGVQGDIYAAIKAWDAAVKGEER